MTSELRGTSSTNRTLDAKQVAALRPATRKRRYRVAAKAAAPVEHIQVLPEAWAIARAALREGERLVIRSATHVDIVRA